MAQIKLTMKLTDGRISWTESHWFFPGAIPSLPAVQTDALFVTALPMATELVNARTILQRGNCVVYDASLSTDEGVHNTVDVPFTPKLVPTPVTIAEEPEICIVMTCLSVQDVNFIGNYQSTFYLSNIPTDVEINQQLLLAGDPQYANDLKAYLSVLAGFGRTIGWGWKAKLKSVPPIPLVANGILPSAAYPGGIDVTMAPGYPTLVGGSIVKLQGCTQSQGRTIRLNGRWRVLNQILGVVTLYRKNQNTLLTATDVGLGAVGTLVPTMYAVVPYHRIFTDHLDKRDRGGRLGLRKGRRSRGVSNV